MLTYPYGKQLCMWREGKNNFLGDVYSSRCEERKKKRVYDAEHSCIAKQCVAEYSEKMDVSVEQHCTIKCYVCSKKTLSETTVLLKEAFGKEPSGDSTIWRWHKAFVDGRESAEFELWGSELRTVVTVTNTNATAAVIKEDQSSHSWYFEKELITEEDTKSEDNESVTDDE